MNLQILNRAGQLPPDGWYQIEVTGEHFNAGAKVVQIIDAAALTSIVNRFGAVAAAPNFAGLLIDQDHFSLDPEKSSEALGWLQEVRNRDGQLEGRIEWTDVGETAVKNKRFKFFSTVYTAADVESVGTRTIKNRAYPAVRPLALDRLALTNDPNNKGGRPISNRNPGASPERSETQPTTMKALLKKMGLSEDASEEAAVAAFITIANRADTAEAKIAVLEPQLAKLREEQVEADLTKYAAVISNRDAAKKMLLANRDDALAFLAGLKPIESPKPITNRATAKTPAEQAAQGSDEAKAEAAVQDYRVKNRCSYEVAHAAVRRAQPDLFKS